MDSLEKLKNYIRSKDNFVNFVNCSEIPEICKSEPCRLGVDEAGRGPVLGKSIRLMKKYMKLLLFMFQLHQEIHNLTAYCNLILGPMVYGVAYCPLSKDDVLKDLGCADSKALTEAKRDEIFTKMLSESEPVNNVGWACEVISPNYISNSMYKRAKHSLNEVCIQYFPQLLIL